MGTESPYRVLPANLQQTALKTLIKLLSNLPGRSGAEPEEHTTSILDQADLVQNLQQTVFQIDLLGTLRFLSPGWNKLTGHNPQHCLRSLFLDYIHPMDRERCRTYFERIILRARETSHHTTMRLIRNNNKPCWVVMRANPIFSRGSDPKVKGIVGTLNDVTQRIQREDLRDARYRSLQNLLDNLACMVYRYRNDRNLTMEYISEGCQELIGYAPRDLINNRNLSYSSLIHPEDRQRIWDQIQAALQQNRPFTVTYRLCLADHSIRWVQEWGRGLFSDSGVLLNIEGFIADITLLQKAHRELHDEHTRLPQLPLLMDRLQRLINRHADNFAVILLAIDDEHKDLNMISAELGKRILQSLPEENTVSILEPGILAILLEQADLEPLIQKLQELSRMPMYVPQPTCLITSMGITTDHGRKDAQLMLLDARTALEQASRGATVMYSPNDTPQSLEQSVAEGELMVHWHPVISLNSGQLRMLQAELIHPHHSNPLTHAEPQTIAMIWQWTLNEILRQLESWRMLANAEQLPGILLCTNSLLEASCMLPMLAPLSGRVRVGVCLSDAALLQATTEIRTALVRELRRGGIHIWLETTATGNTSLPGCAGDIYGLCLPGVLYTSQPKLARGLTRMARELGTLVLIRETQPLNLSAPRQAGARLLQSESRLPTLQSTVIPQVIEEGKNWLESATIAGDAGVESAASAG